MAYRRKTRRKSKGRHRGSKRLSEHMVRAIKAISQIPVETKRFPLSHPFATYLTYGAYSSGSNAIIRANIFNPIPHDDVSTAFKSEESFVGSSIESRGLRWQMNGYLSSAVAKPDVWFRFTVYSENEYFAGSTDGVGGVSPSDKLFDPDHDQTPTWSRWNTQIAKIHFQRKFVLGSASVGQGSLSKKFYIPLRKKMQSADEEGTTVAGTFGEAKGMQYYWVLETLGIGLTALGSDISAVIGTDVYFKDA
ncbi:Cap [Ancient caribou feces associated virus]|uniref:Cap n=1 Tax=Ancient caribou feces associated virus TaxID=1542745 RepID=UPI0004F4BA97|nr:Cap [Ancient caribou feces associated virus]AIM55446.1 Cap [Ancient caribou feces associated virus]